MAQFVDTENIIKRNIKGTFERFTYYLETGGRKVTLYVYCHSEKDFLKLLRLWNRMCVGQCNIYSYSCKGEHTSLSLEDISSDQNHKMKLLLTESNTNTEYIM